MTHNNAAMNINKSQTGCKRIGILLTKAAVIGLAACEQGEKTADGGEGFTPITEELSPEAITEILKERMTALESKMVECEVLGEYHGECVAVPVANGDEKDLVVGGLLDRTENWYVRWFEKTILPRESTPGTIEVPVEMMDEEMFKLELFRLRFRRDGLPSYPDASALPAYKKELIKIGGQKLQDKYHFVGSITFEPFTDANLDELIKIFTDAGLMEQAPNEGEYYYIDLDEIYSQGTDVEKEKAKHVFRPTLALMEDIGKYVNDELHSKYGLPENIRIKLRVTSLGRTEEYQQKLIDEMEDDPKNPGKQKKKNNNATAVKRDKTGEIISASSHIERDATDFGFWKVKVEDTNTGIEIIVDSDEDPELLNAVEFLATKRLLARVKDKDAFGVIESNDCLHIVAPMKWPDLKRYRDAIAKYRKTRSPRE